MKKLEDKRVFITGGANGIGKAIVKAFFYQECKVAFCDVNKEEGNKLLKEIDSPNCHFIKADVSHKEELENAIKEVLEKWGDIDILINNAGISIFTDITETSVEQFDKIIATNLRSVFISSRLLAIHRKGQTNKNRYGRVINIASTRYLMSEPNSEGYAASKGGIVSITHALTISLSKYNITVNCISPGWIETGDYNQLKEEDHSQHPSNRVGVPEDIANACLFICQPENNFLNGQNIFIDGGMTKKMIYVE